MRRKGWFDDLARETREFGEPYNRDGERINAAAWLALYQTPDYQQVAQTRVPRGITEVLVSTVWLGVDEGFRPVPLIFETMVFSGGFPLDRVSWRYASEEEARAGHADVVSRVQALVDVETRWTIPPER